ncbi:PqqD family protein [Nocardiopsis halotolerans]|uniref:PqqD family protein n=1 Tax=Nocardiopsis halotolerans TaxID=124252 RepID=UPI000349BA60|nr:PqqD family protein [Nocardiopsis halotolerans]
MNRTTCTPSESVKFVVEENGGMLLDMDSGHFYGLNPTAARIWKELAAGADPSQVAETLAAETGADLDTVRADVGRLVRELSERGLLRVEGDHS